MKISLVFDDWRDRTGKPIYQPPEELTDALEAGYTPVFWVSGVDIQNGADIYS